MVFLCFNRTVLCSCAHDIISVASTRGFVEHLQRYSQKLTGERPLDLMYFSIHYCPQTKLRNGNVFTPVSQPFCSQGGGIHPQADTPPLADTCRQTPPRANTPPPRRPLQRTVRILLECFLVNFLVLSIYDCFYYSMIFLFLALMFLYHSSGCLSLY